MLRRSFAILVVFALVGCALMGCSGAQMRAASLPAAAPTPAPSPMPLPTPAPSSGAGQGADSILSEMPAELTLDNYTRIFTPVEDCPHLRRALTLLAPGEGQQAPTLLTPCYLPAGELDHRGYAASSTAHGVQMVVTAEYNAASPLDILTDMLPDYLSLDGTEVWTPLYCDKSAGWGSVLLKQQKPGRDAGIFLFVAVLGDVQNTPTRLVMYFVLDPLDFDSDTQALCDEIESRYGALGLALPALPTFSAEGGTPPLL